MSISDVYDLGFSSYTEKENDLGSPKFANMDAVLRIEKCGKMLFVAQNEETTEITIEITWDFSLHSSRPSFDGESGQTPNFR